MRASLAVLVSGGILITGFAIGSAQQGSGPPERLQASDNQATINHRIAVEAMRRANDTATGPDGGVTSIPANSLGGDNTELASLPVESGQDYLVTATIEVTPNAATTIECFTDDAAVKLGPAALVPAAANRSVTIAGVFEDAAGDIALLCKTLGPDAGVPRGQLAVTEVDIQS